MKRILFKGKPFYIPENIAIDDAIPVMNRAYAHSNIAEQIWKDAGTEVAQLTKAGEYNIKWLEGESKIYILPDQFFERTYREHPVEIEQIRQYPILAIGYGNSAYWPNRTVTDLLYSQFNVLPSEEDNFEWLVEDGDTKFILIKTDTNKYIEKKFERIQWAGNQDQIYDYSNTVSDTTIYADPIPGTDGYFWDITCSSSSPYHWPFLYCYGAAQDCIPGVDCDCPYTFSIAEGTTRLETRTRVYNSFIMDDLTDTILQNSVDNDIQAIVYTGTVQGFNDDLCVFHYEYYSTGVDIWVDAGTTYQDDAGVYHFAYIWTYSSWDTNIETRYLTVDDVTIEIQQAPRWPLPGGYVTYSITCAIFPFGGDFAVAYGWAFSSDETDSFTRYGLYWKGVHQYVDVPTTLYYDYYEDIWGRGDRNLVAWVIGVTETEREGTSGEEIFDTLNTGLED